MTTGPFASEEAFLLNLVRVLDPKTAKTTEGTPTDFEVREWALRQVETRLVQVARPYPGVVRSWVRSCTFKQQTVLLSALRGCDGMPRNDVSKKLVRSLRKVVLLSADTTGTSKFMTSVLVGHTCDKLVEDLDKYPMHWLMHFTHACEIVGYKHPTPKTSYGWLQLYKRIVHGLHLNPETEAELDTRLADNEPEREPTS